MNTKALIGIVAVSGILAMAGLVSAGSPYFSWPGRAFAQDSPSVAVTLSPSGTVEQGTAITATMTFSGLAYDSDTSTTDYAFRADVTGASECEGSGLGRTRYFYRVDEDLETRTGTVSASCPAGDYTLTASISSGDSVELASASASFTVAAPAQEPTASPTASIALSPSDAVGEGAEITATMSFGGLASDSDTATTDYVFRADVVDADDCEGGGIGFDRYMYKVDEDPEVRTGTVSADCPAGAYTLRVSISSADDTELASASAGFFVLGAPVLIAPPTLSALSVSHGDPAVDVTLSPAFKSGTLAYRAAVRVAQVTVAPTASDADATVAYLDGNDDAIADADAGADGHQVGLGAGSNTVKVAVSKDGLTTTYTIILLRLVALGQTQTTVNICDRTPEVEDAILNTLANDYSLTRTCETVTDEDLARIEYLYIQDGYSSESIIPGDFAGLTGIIEILIKGSAELTTVPANAFSELTSFQMANAPNSNLGLTYNAIETLHPDAFDGLIGVETISLRSNAIEALHPDTFDGLSALKILSLTANHIKTLEDGVFQDLDALVRLSLAYNRISAFDQGIFGDVSTLEHLDLANNNIATLPEDTFSGMSALRKLYLTNNGIASLPVGIFAGLTGLDTLVLTNNRISPLEAAIFDGLDNLRDLSLRSMNLTSLDAGIFDGLTALQGLDLTANPISVLDEDIFDGLTGLTSLSLRNNRLSNLPADLFAPLSSLTDLSLDENRIESLPADIFDGLTNLRNLQLQNNSITTLDAMLFQPLDESLVGLYLHGNDLTTLHEDIFDGLTGLTTLFLRGNAITELDEDLFDDLDALTLLTLGGNAITTLDAEIFEGLDNLAYLDVGKNSLTSLETDLFDPFDDSLTTLYLTDNDIASLPADIFDGLTGLQRLDLSCNALTALDLGRFDPFAASLLYLDLSGNSFTTNPVDSAVEAKLTAIANYISATETNTECLLPYETGITTPSLSAGAWRTGFEGRQAEIESTVSELTVTVDTKDPHAVIEPRPNAVSHFHFFDTDPDTDGIQVEGLRHRRSFISWLVRAENGASTRLYDIDVYREFPPATNARLRSLTLSGVTLTPGFNSRTFAYTGFAASATTETLVTPVLSDSDATYVIKLNGSADADGRVSLREGGNTIDVEVTAEDETTKKTYRVFVERREPPGEAGPHIVVAASMQVFDRPGGFRERDLIIALYNLEPDATWSGDNYSGDPSTLDYVHRTDILDAGGGTALADLDRRNECEGPELFERNHIQMSVDREIRKVNENPETRDGGVIDTGDCVNAFKVTVTVWTGTDYESEGGRKAASPVAQLTCQFDGLDSTHDNFAEFEWDGEQTGPGWYYHEYVLCTDANGDLAPDSMPTIPDLDWEPPE